MNPDDFNLGMTQNEIQIIKCLRTLKPNENIQIAADNNGLYDTYYVSRNTMIIMSPKGEIYIKPKIK